MSLHTKKFRNAMIYLLPLCLILGHVKITHGDMAVLSGGDQQSVLLGDLNGDQLVNGFDVDPLVQAVLRATYNPVADLNEDGFVNGFDITTWMESYDYGAPSPPMDTMSASDQQDIILFDINGDGLANGFDVAPFVQLVLHATYMPEADLNEDGFVNGFDVTELVKFFDYGAPSPPMDTISADNQQSGILGDVNGDYLVNGFDVDPFVQAVLHATYIFEADMNEDGLVNGFDVDIFVPDFLPGAAPTVTQNIPEPATLLIMLGGMLVFKRRNIK